MCHLSHKKDEKYTICVINGPFINFVCIEFILIMLHCLKIDRIIIEFFRLNCCFYPLRNGILTYIFNTFHRICIRNKSVFVCIQNLEIFVVFAFCTYLNVVSSSTSILLRIRERNILILELYILYQKQGFLSIRLHNIPTKHYLEKSH